MYTKDEIKGIFMCLGKPFTAIYGSEDKTIIRTQVLLRGRTEFLTPLSETLNQYEVESNIQHQNLRISVFRNLIEKFKLEFEYFSLY